jgi:hypothetical protein
LDATSPLSRSAESGRSGDRFGGCAVGVWLMVVVSSIFQVDNQVMAMGR